MEDQPNFSLAFDLPARSQANKHNENETQQARFPNLSEHELEKILAERHSARTKKNTNWSVATFKDKPLANSLKRRTVSEGEHVKISCLQDSGNPSAAITWYKGNDTSGDKTTNSTTLEFQNAASSDEGCTKNIPSTNNRAKYSLQFMLRSALSLLNYSRMKILNLAKAVVPEAVSPGDVGLLSSNYSSLSDGVQCDYDTSGPQPPKNHHVEQQQGAVGSEAISTYAVVDKSGKKVKKKTNKATEQRPVADQDAVVDESKKKNKNEAGNTCAEIDMSKKSTKKPKPGEILYADLGEFHQMKKMHEVSTSPETLPPIKRPEAFAKTQYAEITQYLKGNPEDLGAELLKDSITPAVTNTATGSKVESSAGNTGDSAEATIETGV
ncbi:hypothetical protein AWC38_SpisGene11696 [Stylophora pistillata]|uniref:Ig-like domain-containing protein n=1 Tax=Stylophora pistillata TaxID=50429 RepID=A0A2B4S591_STYPI|nr:hypothetical protein AWC38_SpisGene11696 [Stylophora pistillata]